MLGSRSWNSYIDFAVQVKSNGTQWGLWGGTGSGVGMGPGSASWVKELESRQANALKKAKLEKNISNSRERSGDGDIEGEGEKSVGGDDDVSDMSDFMEVRGSSARENTGSELDFVSQYEEELTGINSEGNGQLEGEGDGEGGAIDRALKLLGLDGRRLSSQGSTSNR